MAGRLFTPDDNVGLTALLVSGVAGNPTDEINRGEKKLQVVLSDGSTVTGLAPVLQHIARHSTRAEQLLGATAVQKAQVFEWLTWSSTELSPLTDDKLQKLNDYLASHTFLVGLQLTLADLVVFGVVHPALEALPTAQLDSFTNLLRWADLIQQTADSIKLFTPIAVPLPPFVPPPPPAAVAPSAKSTAGASAASTATGQQQAGGKKDKAAAAAAGASSSSSSAAVAEAGGGAAAAAAAAAGGKEAKKESKKESKKDSKKEGKAKADGAAAAATSGGGGGKEAEEPRIDMLDIRVGQIVAVQQHPNADALYLEEIDVGEDKPRQVISGLVKFVPKDKMENRRVVVCCNLKPAKMRDIMSFGMVLCASNDTHDQVDPITPPEGVPVGERIMFEGFSNPPLQEVNPKKKILERLFPDLKTSADGTPAFKGVPFMTSKGPVTSTIANAHVA